MTAQPPDLRSHPAIATLFTELAAGAPPPLPRPLLQQKRQRRNHLLSVLAQQENSRGGSVNAQYVSECRRLTIQMAALQTPGLDLDAHPDAVQGAIRGVDPSGKPDRVSHFERAHSPLLMLMGQLQAAH